MLVELRNWKGCHVIRRCLNTLLDDRLWKKRINFNNFKKRSDAKGPIFKA
jgi:hypothetical protein